MEFPHNRILIKSYGKNNQISKNAVICNNKNRCKIKRMHRDVIDLSIISALVTFSCNDSEQIKATKKAIDNYIHVISE